MSGFDCLLLAASFDTKEMEKVELSSNIENETKSSKKWYLSKQDIETVCNNAKKHRSLQLSAKELNKQSKLNHKDMVFDFNMRLDDSFVNDSKISGPRKYKEDRGYDFRLNRNPFDPTIDYFKLNKLRLLKIKEKKKRHEQAYEDREVIRDKAEFFGDSSILQLKRHKIDKVNDPNFRD